jgi:hypothetical protein
MARSNITTFARSPVKWIRRGQYAVMLLRAAIFFLVPACPGLCLSAMGGKAGGDIDALLATCNVSWNAPGPGAAESMPLGNGDIGLNVWVETNGDLVFYISKTDAWGEVVQADDGGLMKIGKVRVALNPNPFVAGTNFQQVLDLRLGEIRIQEGAATIHVWVDTKNPVIRAEVACPQPVSVAVTLENWRPAGPKDVTMPGESSRITWYHRNASTADPHVANLTFGAAINGRGLVNHGNQALISAKPAAYQLISIFPLTAPAPDQWLQQLNGTINRLDVLNLEQTRLEHQAWWNQFWHRSWIFITGDPAATNDTKGYVLQRFVTACGGRGAYPVKFNGSIFVVDDPESPRDHGRPPAPVTADFRTWGGQYWFQNTRAMYWPRLAAGDFDLMVPLFKMYAGQLSGNSSLVRQYYHHDGAYFAETAPFWGGLRYWGPEVKEDWTGHYFTPILELSMMMLDYYEYTDDEQFAKETLVPVATAGLAFFNNHFGRDEQGKLLLDPDNAIEMYWKVHDPAPDIAGLRAVLPRLLALPDRLVDAATRTGWKKMLQEIPPLPVGKKGGKPVLLPYAGEQTAKARNGENPELYAVYPFRLYGLGRPDFQMALDTFTARKCQQKGCWVQDPIQAAMLGLSGVAKEYVSYNFSRSEPRLKFPAFWAKGNDYAPDEDNGGNGENGLQQMLMQADGKKIMLLPAWPKEWDAKFKLNAPGQTTVQGEVRNGKLMDLVVTPPERVADVVDMSLISRK